MSLKNVTGWNIRRVRLQKGLTVHRLSKALPASATLSCEEIAGIELGIRKVFDFEILGISRALGVTIKDLFTTPPRKQRVKQEPT